MWFRKLLVALCASTLFVESTGTPAPVPAHFGRQPSAEGSAASKGPIPGHSAVLRRREALGLDPRQAKGGDEPAAAPRDEEPLQPLKPVQNGQPSEVEQIPEGEQASEGEQTPEDEQSPPDSGDSGGSLCHRVDVEELRDREMSKKIWDESEAGVLADTYIDDNGLDYWVQDLDQEIFDSKGFVSHGWDCRDWGDGCRIQAECTEYEETEHGVAGFFLYYSLQQFYAYMKELHRRLGENAMKEGINIHGIMDDFGVKDSGDDINSANILAGALTMIAGFSAAKAWLVGPFTVLAGAAATVGNTVLDGPEDDTDGGRPLADRVLGQFETLSNLISSANGAVFGIPGINPVESIPKEMQKQSFNNPSVRALADGQWLVADPLDGIKDVTDEMYRRSKQGLAWTMLGKARRAFVLVDRSVSDQAECDENEAAASWDSEEEVCFRLFWVKKGKYVEPVEDDLTKKLQDEPYNLDRLEAYRNAYHCWVDNDGKAGKPDIESEVEKGRLPACFFAMTVKSGHWMDYLGPLSGKFPLRLDGWLDQERDEAGFWDPKFDGV